jgi:hypothetical protein
MVVEGRRYSVSWRLVGQRVEVYVGRRVVEIYHGTDLVATHPLAAQRGQSQTRLEHYPPDKRAFLENPPERCTQRAEAIGPSCAEAVGRLLSDRPYDRLRSVQALLRLCERFGAERLEAACRRAAHYGDPSYRRTKTILEAGLDAKSSEAQEPATVRAPAYRYARQPTTFFPKETASC